MTTGRFSLDDDGEDIVTLHAAEADHSACSGWVNLGEHAVELTLDATGGLCIKTYAKGAEHQVLGSVQVPRLAAALAYLIAERGGNTDPLADAVDDLTKLGFHKDESISGADAVDVMARHYPTLRALAGTRGDDEGEGE